MSDKEFEIDKQLHAVSGYGKCTFLLCAAVGLIVLYPVGSNSTLGEVIYIATSAIVYIAGVYLIGMTSRSVYFIAGVALAASILELVSIRQKNEMLFVFSIVFSTIFYTVIVKHIMKYILLRGPITADKLHGATAVFITLAFLWTGIYVVIEILQPGAFAFADEKNLGDPWRYYDLLFFSFNTLITLGYGDISAISDYARMMSILQQTAGVFFVAVLIARLAGVNLPRGPSSGGGGRG